MKTLLLLLTGLLSIVPYISSVNIEYYDLSKAPMIFGTFISHYSKVYKDITDMLFRYEIFKESLDNINKYNSLNRGFAKVFLDEFADMTLQELKILHDGQMAAYQGY